MRSTSAACVRTASPPLSPAPRRFLPALLTLATLLLAADPPGARQLDARLGDGADVVIVGNSKVATDIDTTALASTLGRSVAPLGVHGSKGPVWYAVLADRVYGRGYAPKWVVAYGPLVNALPMAMTAAELTRLAEWVGSIPSGILTRWFGGWDDAIHARWTAPRPGRCEPPGDALPEAPTVATSVPESALVGLAKLAQDRGARLAFVRQPLAPSGELQDEVEPALEAQARTAVAAADGAWIDLPPGLADESLYGDGVHMSAAGRATTTPALAAALAAWIDGAEPAVVPPSPSPKANAVPLPLSFTAVGACEVTAPLPPGMADVDDVALAALGLPGPAFEVLFGSREVPHGAPGPDCTLRWWATAGALHVALAAGPARRLTVSIAANGEASGSPAHWLLPGVTLDIPTASRGYALADGHLLAGDRKIRLRKGELTLGATGPVTADVPVALLDSREIDLRDAAWSFTGALPTLTSRWKAPGPRPETARYTLDRFVPSEEAIFDAAGVGRCAPLRSDDLTLTVSEGGFTADDRGCAPLPRAPVPVHLDAERRCAGPSTARWLYPGDAATIPLPPLSQPWRLVLAGGVVGSGGELRIRIESGGRTVTEEAVPLGSFALGATTVALPRLPKGATLSLVSTSAEGWLLLTRVVLVRTVGER